MSFEVGVKLTFLFDTDISGKYMSVPIRYSSSPFLDIIFNSSGNLTEIKGFVDFGGI